MGKFRDKFKEASKKVYDKANELAVIEEGPANPKDFDDFGDDIFNDDDLKDNINPYDVNIQPAQKPESFHHFLLENQYKDLELLIRGYKEVFNKDTNKWEIKRKGNHCFTDEEAEDILRIAQSHLSTDIKLSYININIFPIKMLAIYEQIQEYFYTIADYKYGRYGGSKVQLFMKHQNLAIFTALMERIQANYSRAIQGAENRQTHSTVKGQESLNNTDRDRTGDRGYY